MKNWTINQARQKDAVSPDALNDELRVAASSIQSLDRAQLPQACIGQSRLEAAAIHKVWCEPYYPKTLTKEGEQTNVRDSNTKLYSWSAITYQLYAGSWLSLVDYQLAGYKGGNLFCEWAGNGMVWGAPAIQEHNRYPGVPKYIRLRMSINGVTLAERFGPGHMEHWRLFGSMFAPPGDLTLRLEFSPTIVGPDDPTLTAITLNPIMQGHLFSMKFFCIGRWR